VKKIIITLVLVASLSGCKTTEERAQGFYEQAQVYIAEGDTGRALVELRNALQRDETFLDARRDFANLLLADGRTRDAYGQYVKVTELSPNDLDANLALAQLTFDAAAWEDSEKFAQVAIAQAPDDLPTQSILLALEYRQAQLNDETVEMVKVAMRSQALLEQDETLLQARRVVVIEDLRLGQYASALEHVDAGLEQDPESRSLLQTKLSVLQQLGMDEEIEATLVKMSRLFPDDEVIARYLMTYYLRGDRTEDAQAYLFEQIDPTSEVPGDRFTYLRFVARSVSNTAMRSILTDMLAETPEPADIAAHRAVFEALLAGSAFSDGDRDIGMAEMQRLIEENEPSEEQDRFKIQLARMYMQSYNPVGARTLVEQVLDHDPGQAEALKMRSTWLISEDNTDGAIRLLRDALAGNPNDSEALTLLASAYQRDGRTELMGEMLARAVEVSSQGAEESQRYAALLASHAEFIGAETVILKALRRQPQHLQLLTDLANVYFELRDWGRAGQVISDIRTRFETSQGVAVANELQARLLSVQEKNDELSDFLDGLASGSAIGPQISVIRNTVRQGNIEQGLALSRTLAQDNPNNPSVLMVLAQVLVASGAPEEGYEVLKLVTERVPSFEQGWLALYASSEDKAEILERGLEALPESAALSLAYSSALEAKGDFEGAMVVYERLYAANSEDIIIANNLASTISVVRTDEASLERAWLIARRLAGTSIPAFLDTYGWISFLRGEMEEASRALEVAVAGQPTEPTIQYHAGRLYAATGRVDEARAAYAAAQDLLSKGAPAAKTLSADIISALADL
jgi:tetratricopeptide (TPR) repeat protein